MKHAGRSFLVGALATAALAFTLSNASAAVICTDDGDCWHTHTDYSYPDHAGIVVHPDNWAWGDGDHYRWREHEGRGYWHGDDWVPF
jgi:hypothetical protein